MIAIENHIIKGSESRKIDCKTFHKTMLSLQNMNLNYLNVLESKLLKAANRTSTK